MNENKRNLHPSIANIIAELSKNGLPLESLELQSTERASDKLQTEKDTLKKVESMDSHMVYDNLQPCKDINHARRLIHESKQKSVQLTLKDATENMIFDQVDTELHATIGQISSHLCTKLNVARVLLLSNGTLLDDNEKTLADYYWVIGSQDVPRHCWTITVEIVRQHTIDTTY